MHDDAGGVDGVAETRRKFFSSSLPISFRKYSTVGSPAPKENFSSSFKLRRVFSKTP